MQPREQYKLSAWQRMLGVISVTALLFHFKVPTAWSCLGLPQPPNPPHGPSPEPGPNPTPQPEPACGRGAAQVTPNGLGDLLLFPYWTTEDRTTLIAFGNGAGGQEQTFVHVRVRECVSSQDIRDFSVCLSPGDVWT